MPCTGPPEKRGEPGVRVFGNGVMDLKERASNVPEGKSRYTGVECFYRFEADNASLAASVTRWALPAHRY